MTERTVDVERRGTGTRTAPVVVDDVTVRFTRRGRAPFTALDTLRLEVPERAVTCLLGPNGSGKTTLLNTVVGLARPTSGSVRVLGADPVRDRAAVLRSVAVVPQETAVYAELTARENLGFHAAYYGLPRRVRRARVAEALDVVGLTSRADDRAGTFSGGMQRRLALARALMMAPPVLLLDEPTLGVDVQSREAIWDRVRQVAADGGAVLLTTNYMEEAQTLGDRIVIIDRGRTVAAGTLAELTGTVPPSARRTRVPDVSLQDVFLHHTGRGLRD